MIEVSRVSPFTGIWNTMVLDITDSEIENWENGALIQNAFPRLNADEREFLKTGIYPGEWPDE